MERVLPKHPEKVYESVPKRLSRESQITELTTYEDIWGIVFDRLSGLREGIRAYVKHARGIAPKGTLDVTFEELDKRLAKANEKVIASRAQAIESLREEIEAMTDLVYGNRRAASLNLSKVLDIYRQCECLHDGELSTLFSDSSRRFSEKKDERNLLDTREIKVYTKDHRFVLSIGNDELEKGLAAHLGKERLIHEAGVHVKFGEVNGTWYNLPFFDILRRSGLRGYEKTQFLGDAPSKTPRIIQAAARELGEKLMNNGTNTVIHLHFPFKKDGYFARVEFENLHLMLLPEAYEDDERWSEERAKHRYAQIRGDNLVGPAWTVYRSGKWARVQPPKIKISLEFYRKEYLGNDIEVVDEKKIQQLVDARDKLAANLREMQK